MAIRSRVRTKHPIRWFVGLVAVAIAAGAFLAPTGQAAPHAAPTWVLKWSPQADQDGLNAFEGIENRGTGKEIYTQGNDYRIDIKTTDRDGSDRQRNEVKGMKTPSGQILTIDKGSSWRFTYSMYIPSTLKATTSFTHIMQMKEPGTGTGPIFTIDLRKSGSSSLLQLVIFKTDTVIGSTNLIPLQNKWINVDLAVKFDDAPNGTVHFIVNDGTKNVIDASKTGVGTWLADRARPKWGIYRSIKDTADLENTYLLLTDMKAYELQ